MQRACARGGRQAWPWAGAHLEADFFLQQLLEVATTQALQHLGLLCRRRPEMALNKPSVQEPPSTLAL